MQRRSVLKALTGLAAIPVLSSPALAQSAKSRTLRLVPTADLNGMDPIWGNQFVVRNAAVLVWDTLYGMDSNMQAQRQMVESESVSDDGKVWTFRLRPNLKFHDGEPVRAKDVVASLTRWSARDVMGQMLKALQVELTAVDDRTFRWTLSAPFPRMKDALGKLNPPCTFIMPERIAKTDPFEQIREYVGSGPYRFVAKEWVPGAKAVFEKFEDYVPRDEPSSWLAGGKRVYFDRVEWVVISDPSVATAALQTGEVDWYESPIPDLVPILRNTPGVTADISNPLGNVGAFRFNHLTSPFKDAKARHAVMTAMRQADYMMAIVGDNPNLWKPMGGFFTPGTPLYTEVGGGMLLKNDMQAAKRLLAESSYDGSPVVCLLAQDQPIAKAMGDVTVDLLTRIGFKVDAVATDWGTVGQRRASKAPLDQGGWSMLHTWLSGTDCINPAAYPGLRANGKDAWFGWPSSSRVEAERDAWFAARNPAEEMATIERLNTFAVDDGVFAPTGFFLGYQAWRTNLSGIVPAPLPLVWGVRKT